MAAAKDKNGSKPDKSKDPQESSKSTSSKGHPFLVGITLGLIFGVVFGWWVPAPGFFEKVKVNTTEQMKKGSVKAKENLADSLENTADKLRD